MTPDPTQAHQHSSETVLKDCGALGVGGSDRLWVLLACCTIFVYAVSV